MPAGRGNAITDVAGVRVGHMTLVQGDSLRTGGIAHHGSGDHEISFSTDTASPISQRPLCGLFPCFMTISYHRFFLP
jgi:L-aminopeptidase/D-esterase-like protein